MSKIATIAVLIGIIIIAVIVGIFIITNPSTPAPAAQNTQNTQQTQQQGEAQQQQPATDTAASQPAQQLGSSANPQYGTPMPFDFQIAMKYPDFTLTFIGTELKNGTGAINTTTVGTHHFTIVDASGAEQQVDIPFGELPPQPTDFTVGGKTFTLATFTLPDGTQLPEGSFEVVEK
jgi:hypothetical protein